MNAYKLLLATLLTFTSITMHAQNVGINTTTPDPSAALDVVSSDKGLLIPRMSSAERQSISSPGVGLMVFDNTTNAFYYFNGIGWLEMLAGNVNMLSDADGDTKIEVEQSPNEDKIRFDLAGVEQMRLSSNSAGIPLLYVNSVGGNLFMGTNAGTVNTGIHNTFIGQYAGYEDTSGIRNTFIGSDAGREHKSGGNNTFVGSIAGFYNVNGENNVFLGKSAGYNNLGSGNIFIGNNAGYGEVGSNKLYIANSFSNLPMIYGEFDNRLVKINGTLQVNDGTQAAGKVLTSDDSGIASWELTDDQTLAFSGTNLSISEGNSINLATSLIENRIPNNNVVTGQNAGIDISGSIEASTIRSASIRVGDGNSTVISNIIKVTKNIDLPNIPSNDLFSKTVTVTGAQVGATVFVSPQNQLEGSCFIGYCRVSALNTVEITVLNEGGNAQDMPAMDFYITVIQ